jgi:hypothetical protein
MLLIGGPSSPQMHVYYRKCALDAGAPDSGGNTDAAAD